MKPKAAVLPKTTQAREGKSAGTFVEHSELGAGLSITRRWMGSLEANLSRYVLGLREEKGSTDQAVTYRTAARTLKEVRAWQAEGGTVTVILRGGKRINDTVLRRDAKKEREAFEESAQYGSAFDADRAQIFITG